MNRKKILLLGILGVVVLGGVVGFKILNKNTMDTNITQTDDTLKNTINEKVAFTNEFKTVAFDTAEEMFEFSDTIFNIQNEEEGISFIENFLITASTNKPELIIGKYHSQVRDVVIENKLFPIYDDSGCFSFRFDDIVVECINSTDGDFTEYSAKYTTVMIDEETGEDFYSFDSIDTFKIRKDSGKLYIINYDKKTSNKKQLVK